MKFDEILQQAFPRPWRLEGTEGEEDLVAIDGSVVCSNFGENMTANEALKVIAVNSIEPLMALLKAVLRHKYGGASATSENYRDWLEIRTQARMAIVMLDEQAAAINDRT